MLLPLYYYFYTYEPGPTSFVTFTLTQNTTRTMTANNENGKAVGAECGETNTKEITEELQRHTKPTAGTTEEGSETRRTMRRTDNLLQEQNHTENNTNEEGPMSVLTTTAQTEPTIGVTTTTGQSAVYVYVKQCRFSHEGPQNFRDETNPSYARNPYYLHGKMCVDCKGLITHEGKGGRTEEEGQIFWKPSTKYPVWACLGVPEKNCEQVLCSTCFQRKFMK